MYPCSVNLTRAELSYPPSTVPPMDERDFYRRPDPGSERLLRGLPRDVAAMAAVVGGVLMHRDWAWRFGFTLPSGRRDEANTRAVAAILSRLGTLDALLEPFLRKEPPDPVRNVSWNSSHPTPGCSTEALAKVGGAGLTYCFAVN